MNNFAVVIVVLLIAAGGAVGVFYTTEWQPMIEKRAEIQGEIDRLKNKKAELDNIDQDIQDLNKKITDANDRKDKLKVESNQLDTVVPKVLESTELIANKFKVKFQDIRISPLVRAEEWSELPIELSVLGTFHQVGSFLKVMEKRKIINLAAGSMNVSVSAETDRESKSPLLSVTISAKVYIMGSGY